MRKYIAQWSLGLLLFGVWGCTSSSPTRSTSDSGSRTKVNSTNLEESFWNISGQGTLSISQIDERHCGGAAGGVLPRFIIEWQPRKNANSRVEKPVTVEVFRTDKGSAAGAAEFGVKAVGVSPAMALKSNNSVTCSGDSSAPQAYAQIRPVIAKLINNLEEAVGPDAEGQPSVGGVMNEVGTRLVALVNGSNSNDLFATQGETKTNFFDGKNCGPDELLQRPEHSVPGMVSMDIEKGDGFTVTKMDASTVNPEGQKRRVHTFLLGKNKGNDDFIFKRYRLVSTENYRDPVKPFDTTNLTELIAEQLSSHWEHVVFHDVLEMVVGPQIYDFYIRVSYEGDVEGLYVLRLVDDGNSGGKVSFRMMGLMGKHVFVDVIANRNGQNLPYGLVLVRGKNDENEFFAIPFDWRLDLSARAVDLTKKFPDIVSRSSINEVISNKKRNGYLDIVGTFSGDEPRFYRYRADGEPFEIEFRFEFGKGKGPAESDFSPWRSTSGQLQILWVFDMKSKTINFSAPDGSWPVEAPDGWKKFSPPFLPKVVHRMVDTWSLVYFSKRPNEEEIIEVGIQPLCKEE